MTMKAYSLLTVKSVDDGARVIRGIATSPTVDRMGDIVEPDGAVFRGPINLHLYHNHELPVGNVQFGAVKAGKMPFEAMIPDVQEAGTVRERVNEAWHSVKYRLLGAVSIGFRALEDGVELLKSGGLRFTKWEMLELSLVSVPANPDALIQSFKSADSAAIRSALGITIEADNEREELARRLINRGIPLVSARDQHIQRGAVSLR